MYFVCSTLPHSHASRPVPHGKLESLRPCIWERQKKEAKDPGAFGEGKENMKLFNRV